MMWQDSKLSHLAGKRDRGSLTFKQYLFGRYDFKCHKCDWMQMILVSALCLYFGKHLFALLYGFINGTDVQESLFRILVHLT